jgi:hypothetical protein
MARRIVAIICLAFLPALQVEARGPTGHGGGSVLKAVVANATNTEGKSSSKTVKTPVNATAAAATMHSKTASLVKINPPLKDVSSDKKFFGPPFPADYPDDKRPTVSPSIAWQLKEEGKPYPYLQNRQEFDKDYVKDENSDKGDWKAQFDYDAYRRRLAKEETDVKRAKAEAAKEAADEKNAEKDADDANSKVADAQKAVDEATGAENAAGKDDGSGGGDSGGDGMSAEDKAKLEDLRKKVAEAAANYEKEKKEFEECKRQLEKAKKDLADLKQQVADYEVHMVAQTKMFAIKLETKKNAKEAKKAAAAARVKEAQEKFKMLDDYRQKVEATLAKEKADNEIAQKNLQKHKMQREQAAKHLEEAKLHLQTLRGYKTAPAHPSKSGASLVAGFNLALILALVYL